MSVIFLFVGCSSALLQTARSIPVLYSLEEVSRPFGIIGKVETKSQSVKSVHITRQQIQQIALTADTDVVLIANINPLPDEPFFYTVLWIKLSPKALC